MTRSRFFIGTAAALSLVALAACEDQNTSATTGDESDRVVTTAPASPSTAADNAVAKSSDPAGSSAPAELTAETRDYVQTATMGDMFEVEASKIALMRAQSAEVKKFAQDMIDAHTNPSDEIKSRLARVGLIVELPAMLDAEHQKKLEDLKSASAEAFEARYIAQQKEAHEAALMLHSNYATHGTVPDLKALAADTVPKVEMHVKMVSQLQSTNRTG